MSTVRTTVELRVRSGPGTTYPESRDPLQQGVTVNIDDSKTAVVPNVYAYLRIWFNIAGQPNQWICAYYTEPVSTPAPVPPTQPVPPTSNHYLDPTRRGVGTNVGGWTPSNTELSLISRNSVKQAFIIAWEAGQAAAAIPRLRSAGILDFAFRADHHGIPVSASDFINRTLPNLKEYAQAIGSSQGMLIQIHNEPNVAGEGWGKTWKDGAQFASFWMTVAAAYRLNLPGCLCGFPALSPGGYVAGVREDEAAFANEAIIALHNCDWIGIHAYWVTPDGSGFAPNVGLYRRWNKQLIGTEIGPVNPAIVNAGSVLHAYSVMQGLQVPCMAWVLDGTGAFPEASWTVHNIQL